MFCFCIPSVLNAPNELLSKDLKENINFRLRYIFSAVVKKNLVFLDALRFVWGDGAWEI